MLVDVESGRAHNLPDQPQENIALFTRSADSLAQNAKYRSSVLVLSELILGRFHMNDSATHFRGKTGLPLVRLSLLVPFMRELERRQIDVESVFSEYDLARETLFSPDVFVPAVVVYQLIERMAEAADDPYLGFHIGETLDLVSWPLFSDAVRMAATFGDFFFRFSSEAGNQANSVQMRLETDGLYATFRSYRLFIPNMAPAQADAFYVGLFSSIFQRCVGRHWNPNEVRISTCDPSAIPPDYNKLMITRGDRRGCSTRFPQSWLLLPFDIKEFQHRTQLEITYKSPPNSLNESIKQALLPHLHRTDLTTERAAKLCGYGKRALTRKLNANGTTLTDEIARLKEECAVRKLLDTDMPITDIANSLGFSDPSGFTRSFKKWTGMSPRKYRQSAL